MKYDPSIKYCPAFDDGELFVDNENEFTDSELCKYVVEKRNKEERARLKGKIPDTIWFVAKVRSQVTIEWAPKKRVIRKAPSK